MLQKNSKFTWPVFHTDPVSYELGTKNIVFNICELSTLKPFNNICQVPS